MARGVLAFLVTPFVVTGVFRLFDAVPTAVPFLAVLSAAAWVWVARRHLRPVAVGMAAAAVAHGVFLLWLFGEMDLGRLG